MTDMTQEQAKLRLAEVEEMLETANRGQNAFDLAEIRGVLRALLASQTALRSGCIGCQEGWPFDGTNAFGEPNHAIPIGRLNDDKQHWDHCYLSDEQRAALLNKGDGDGLEV